MEFNRCDEILIGLEGSRLLWYAVSVGVVLTMSILTLIYGLISWKIIRKFRNFKNFMYLNAVLVNILRLLLTFVCMLMLYVNTDFYSCNVVFVRIYFSFFLYLTMAYNHWLLVMNYIFYVNVVNVFQNDIKRKYLKSWLFGWVLPFVIFLILTTLFMTERREGCWLLAACNIVPFSVNLLIFVKVLWNLVLVKDRSVGVMTKKERWMETCRRLTMVVVIFALTSAVMLSSMIWVMFKFVTFWRAISLGLQMVTLAFYVPCVKSNRELWREYFVLRSRRTI